MPASDFVECRNLGAFIEDFIDEISEDELMEISDDLAGVGECSDIELARILYSIPLSQRTALYTNPPPFVESDTLDLLALIEKGDTIPERIKHAIAEAGGFKNIICAVFGF